MSKIRAVLNETRSTFVKCKLRFSNIFLFPRVEKVLCSYYEASSSGYCFTCYMKFPLKVIIFYYHIKNIWQSGCGFSVKLYLVLDLRRTLNCHHIIKTFLAITKLYLVYMKLYYAKGFCLPWKGKLVLVMKREYKNM